MTVDTDDTHSVFGVLYSLVSAVVIIGHQVWLYIIQRHVLADLGHDPEDAALDALLTWLPLALWVVVGVLGTGVALGCCREPWAVIRCINSSAVISMLFTYSVQIIYYLIRDILLYVEQLTPTEALCYCAYYSALSQQTGSDLYNCTCLVPFASCRQTLVTSENVSAGLDSSALQDSGIKWNGDVVVRQGAVVEAGPEVRSIPGFVSLNEMFIVLALSLIVSVLRFPLWTTLRFLVTLVRDKRDKRKVTPRGKVTASDSFRFGFPWRWVRDNWIEGDAVEVCYVGFVEGIDSFSLLGAILNHGDHFAEDRSLLAATLFLASFNLMIVHLSGVLVALRPPRRPRPVSNHDEHPESHNEAFYVAAIATLPYFSHRRREKKSRRHKRKRDADRGEAEHKVRFSEGEVEKRAQPEVEYAPTEDRDCCQGCCTLKHFTLVAKFLMIISCNLPFFIFRMYLYYLFGGFVTKGEPVFLLLTIKEAVILLMGILRFAVSNKKEFKCDCSKQAE